MKRNAKKTKMRRKRINRRGEKEKEKKRKKRGEKEGDHSNLAVSLQGEGRDQLTVLLLPPSLTRKELGYEHLCTDTTKMFCTQ